MLGLFLDTETNGLNPRIHHILEFAWQLVDLKTGTLLDQFETTLTLSPQMWEKSDPESLQINQFSWEMVQDGISFERAGEETIARFGKWGFQRKKGVFICQNPSFDRAFFAQIVPPEIQERLNWPYHWLDLASMHWALTLRAAKENRGPLPWDIGVSKDAIAQFYHLPSEEKPHRAMNGVAHLLLCYRTMLGFPHSSK